MTVDSLKNQGNSEFKNGNYKQAIDLYTQAISNNDKQQLAVLYKNRAMAYIKLGDKSSADLALNDCNCCLKIVPNDLKAQFRRVLALELLERIEDAYLNAKDLLEVEPKNSELQTVLKRLYISLQERASKQSQLSNKVNDMMRMCFDKDAAIQIDSEKRQIAFENLLVLARNAPAIELLLENDLLTKIIKLSKIEKNHESVILTSIRIIGEICKSSVDNIIIVLRKMGISWFIDILDSDNEERVNASMYCIQTILNTLSGMKNNVTDKPNKDLCDKYKNEIDTVLICLTCSINNVLLNGLARDAVIELLMRNVHYTALSWAERFLEIDGLERLMDCVCEMDEFRNESSLRLTKSTKVIVGACLSRVYENMYYDEARNRFFERIEQYVKSKLLHPDFEWKVRIVAAITVLLRGTLDVGSSIISRPGIMNMILAMADCETELEQKVSLECIIAAASKKDKAQALVSRAVDRLKQLYKSTNEAICVRALVSLCKIGSLGGSDASVRPFQDGSTVKLTDACLVFLKKRKDLDSKKWAAEGLAYLTMDAEVKEKLVDDRDALKTLLDLPKSQDESVLYGVVTTLVNLCNAYDKQEILPEMLEMAKFAKYHVPQEHELDDEDFVNKRIDTLSKAGVVSSLNSFAKTQSYNSRELISRVLNAICSQVEHRGLVVQQGGVKMLLKFATDGSAKGKRFASQALARIGITMNPEVAFSGQRSLEVVRPLLNLLDADFTALENFEALMALCNLASLNEPTRLRILSENGLSRIQIYMFEEHVMLKRAAVQVITNLMLSERVRTVFEGGNDLTKYLVILCCEEDYDTALAAAGALCVLVGNSEKACQKIFEAASWLESFQSMLAQSQIELQYRAVYILSYLMSNSRDTAEKIIETNIMEILMALSLQSDNEKVKNGALEALKSAEKWGIIKKSAFSS